MLPYIAKFFTFYSLLVNAVEFKGGTHIKFEQKYMREHLVHCFEKCNFSAFPKNHVGFASKNIKINTKLSNRYISPFESCVDNTQCWLPL
jgi:preprotein translocase subunit SecF